MGSIFNEMRENADKIQDYPELKIIAKQMREDASILEKAISGAAILASTLVGIIIILLILVFNLKGSFDKMADRYDKHLDGHNQIIKTQ